jgi:hypothetical protein
MIDPLLNLIIDINKLGNDALDRAEQNIAMARKAFTDINAALQPKERKIEKDDDGFELPHLDPEDDPDTRNQMERDIDQGKTDPNEDRIPF